jgi:protein SCO1
MKSICKRTLVGLLGVALLVGVAYLQGGHTAHASGAQTKRVKTPRERLAERSFPNVTLTTHEGKKVRFYDDLLKDKIASSISCT